MKTQPASPPEDTNVPTFEVFVRPETDQAPIEPVIETEPEPVVETEPEPVVETEPEPRQSDETKPLDAEQIAAFEAALQERCPYTGQISQSENLRDLQPKQPRLRIVQGEKPTDSVAPRKKRRNTSGARPIAKPRRSRPLAAALFVGLIIAIAAFAYARVQSDDDEKTNVTQKPSAVGDHVYTAGMKLVKTISDVKIVEQDESPDDDKKASIQMPATPVHVAKAATIAVKTENAETEVVEMEKVETQAIENGHNSDTENTKVAYDGVMNKVMATRNRTKRLKLLRDAIALYPKGDEAPARLAIELMESKNTRPEALELAKRAADLNSDNARAWLAIGYIHQLEKNRAASQDAYQRCAATSGPRLYVKECRTMLPKSRPQ